MGLAYFLTTTVMKLKLSFNNLIVYKLSSKTYILICGKIFKTN